MHCKHYLPPAPTGRIPSYYNKAIRDEICSPFSGNISVNTAHGYKFAAHDRPKAANIISAVGPCWNTSGNCKAIITGDYWAPFRG